MRIALPVALIGLAPVLAAQSRATLSPEVRQYISVDAPVVALTNVRVIDGTGVRPAAGQTILIEGQRIARVGRTGAVPVPAGARVLDLPGHTVVPGFVGLHNHTFYSQTSSGGLRTAQAPYTGPRLYLGSGVTTTRTTGSLSPYAEINLKANIDRGEVPGPRMHVTGPYLIGPGPATRLAMLGMHELRTEADARRVVAYWAEEGATWVKAYTQISRAVLGAVIDEAHRHGMKVTAHLCSVGFREAVALGIDQLEHGLYANAEYDPDKEVDECPAGYRFKLADLDVNGPAVRTTIQDIVANGVAMTSTLAVIEQGVPNRARNDARALELLAPHAREEVLARRRSLDGPAEDSPLPKVFENGMAFEVAFVRAGGLLAAGVDPGGTALPGYGDQRNYELLVEAGFSPTEAIQIVSANGAKVLGEFEQVGTITAGKLADLVVIRGDPATRPEDIRNVVLVFKDGLGYDSAKLIASVKGLVGIR